MERPILRLQQRLEVENSFENVCVRLFCLEPGIYFTIKLLLRRTLVLHQIMIKKSSYTSQQRLPKGTLRFSYYKLNIAYPAPERNLQNNEIYRGLTRR